MIKLKLSLISLSVITSVTLLWLFLATAATAQGEPPSPYTGLKNPFPWGDVSAQEAGRGIYQRSCLGCHGANGSNLADANFSLATYPQGLESRADFYFWIVSEGMLSKGMPAYKSSLSDEQRWQVLTYLWSLGKAAPPQMISLSLQPPVTREGIALLLTAPKQAQSGQPLTLTTSLKDNQGKPLKGAIVKFFVRMDFFAAGLMEIGEAETNEQGVALFEFVPRQSGDTQIVARYEGIETSTAVTLVERTKPFYQAEAGIRLPALGPDLMIGPKLAFEVNELGKAPLSAFRLPGGLLSWLLLLVAAVLLVWTTYFRVIYQVFRISSMGRVEDTLARMAPVIVLMVIVAFGILLVTMILTGPYTNPHLLR